MNAATNHTHATGNHVYWCHFLFDFLLIWDGALLYYHASLSACNHSAHIKEERKDANRECCSRPSTHSISTEHQKTGHNKDEKGQMNRDRPGS